MDGLFKNNLKVHKLTPEELGMTEDEFSNWQIEWHLAIKEMNKAADEKGRIEVPVTDGFPQSITITLTPKCFVNYLYLNEQNN